MADLESLHHEPLGKTSSKVETTAACLSCGSIQGFWVCRWGGINRDHASTAPPCPSSHHLERPPAGEQIRSLGLTVATTE
ncbi:hypothetical protein LZ30DRAFT_722911 [Colletotrichum cereale]|nr:hypothetical protein LZ30DRAFT_722911 [Colletotrichum cereale]